MAHSFKTSCLQLQLTGHNNDIVHYQPNFARTADYSYVLLTPHEFHVYSNAAYNVAFGIKVV